MTLRAPPPAPDTASRILDVAESLLQTRGYHATSYAVIAAEVGLTKAALHYHFPSKADLGLAALERYRAGFAAAFGDVDARNLSAPERLHAFAQLYLDVLRRDRLCLCAMLAAEQWTLDPPIRSAVDAFFGENLAWLTSVVAHGRDEGTLAGVGTPEAVAEVMLGTLEGAMLIAWARRDADGFQRTAQHLFATLAPAR